MIEQKHIPKSKPWRQYNSIFNITFRETILTHKQLTQNNIVTRINHPCFCFTRLHFLWIFNCLYSFFFFFNYNSLYKTIHCFKNNKKQTQILLKLFLDKQSIISTFVILKSLDFNKRSLSVFQAHPCSIREYEQFSIKRTT
jgi:hypothetical protein